MPQQELLKRVVQVLGGAGIEYMITGSIVSSLQGEPRATHDIDIVVQLPVGAVPRLVRLFREPEYYIDEHSVREAIASNSMFSVIDMREADKIDFWVLTSEPFDQSRFARRLFESIEGVPMHVSRPEDTILMKLRWAQMSGGSERQFRDALRVYEVQAGRLDLDYLARWASQLGVQELWTRLTKEAQPASGG